MSELVRICGKEELPAVGMAKEFRAGEKFLCVANVNGTICALDNECPHEGGPLSEGMVEEGKIVCPWHAWEIDAQTGRAGHFPQAKVEVYELILEGNELFAKV